MRFVGQASLPGLLLPARHRRARKPDLPVEVEHEVAGIDMDLIIRAFCSSDASAVSAVIRETMSRSNSADYPLSRLQPLIDYFSPQKVQQLGTERRCLVAEVGDEVVGTVSLDESELCTFFVHPDFQGRGIGSKLLEAMEAIAVSDGCQRLHIDASLTAIPFYTAMGYRRTGIDIDGTAGPQVGLEKYLPNLTEEGRTTS